jgi:uncharacterized membrane protein
MAGVSLAFTKIGRVGSLSGLTRLTLQTTLAATGPWLLTVLSLVLISSIGRRLVTPEHLFEFRALLIYNFAFSLVLAAPFCMASARFLADADYSHETKPRALSMLWAALLTVWLFAWPLALGFYLLVTSFPPALIFVASLNFSLLAGLWVVMAFVASRNDYLAIAKAFAAGQVLGTASSLLLASSLNVLGLMLGFTAGLVMIFMMLFAWILRHESHNSRQTVSLLVRGLNRSRVLVFTGLVLNVSIWTDKWVMWLAPEAQKSTHGLIVYPTYDSAMFLAYLAMVPAMGLFFYHAETGFRPLLKRLMDSIQNRLTLAEIEACHLSLTHFINSRFRSYLLLMGTIVPLGFILAPKILPMVGGTYLQLGIFRFGLLGACFQVLTMFVIIMLINFDDQKGALRIALLGLLLTALLTMITLFLGFPTYGMGFFFASFIAFLYGFTYFLSTLKRAVSLFFIHK